MISIPIFSPDAVRRSTLANGLTVLVRRDTSAPVVAVVTHVKAGYFDESDAVAGIAHVLEHMYFKGTGRRGVGEISRETKAAGGYLNAATTYDHTSYRTVLPTSGFERGLDIQADAFANSSIDAGELARELEVIIQEAKRKADSPSALATESLYALLHDRHRMRRWRIGTEAGLRGLTRGDVVHFYRTYYRPRNTILCIVGDVDRDMALDRAEEAYGSIPDGDVPRDRGPDEPPREGFRYRELDGDIMQAQLAFGWPVPGPLHPDTPPLDLAAIVLGHGRGSRLYRAVRERGLAATVTAQNVTTTERGVFMVRTEGPMEHVRDAARASWEQLRDLRQKGVIRDELWRAKRILESRWIRGLETMEGQANYLAEWESLGDWTMGGRRLERLLSEREDQVTEVLRRYLVPQQCGLVAYRSTIVDSLADDAPAMLRTLAHPRPAPLAASSPRVSEARPRASLAPRFEREEGGVRVYRTALDVPILVRRKSGSPLVHMALTSIGGASDEDADLAGLSSLLARTCIKGTERRTAARIAEDAELMGGIIAPNVGAESFGWSISVPTGHALEALELLADVAQRPLIPDEALATERAVAIADLASLRDDMYRYPLRLIAQAAFAGHPYGMPASGTEETLVRIDAERVRSWHARRIIDGPTVLALVGDIDPDDAAAALARYFARLRGGTVMPIQAPRWPARRTCVTESREKAQTALALAFPSPARREDERYAASMIATVASGLGGRFFEELRDRRSLAYTIQAFSAARRTAGVFVSYIATSPEREEVARDGLLAEFAKFREELVSDEELFRAKEYAIGAEAIHQQSGGAVLGDVVETWTLGTGLRELEEHIPRIRAVSAADMRDVALRYFDESRLVQAIVRGVGTTVRA